MKKLFLLLTAVLMAAVCALAQNRSISGTVISGDDQEPLAGVTVMPVGGGQGTATDIDGNFTKSYKHPSTFPPASTSSHSLT